jgi:mannosyltransferase OCH1-like enzyme
MTIPRVVYLTWKTRDLPPEYRETLRHNEAMNPGYRFVLCTDEDLERLFAGADRDLCEAYRRLNPRLGQARADMFRAFILWKNGGVYMDIKIRCKTPIDRWLRTDSGVLWFSYWDGLWFNREYLGNAWGEVQNWIIAAPPGNGVLMDFLRTTTRRILSATRMERMTLCGKTGVVLLTGPVAYTRVVEKHTEKTRFRSVDHLDYGSSFHGLDDMHYSLGTEPVILIERDRPGELGQ